MLVVNTGLHVLVVNTVPTVFGVVLRWGVWLYLRLPWGFNLLLWNSVCVYGTALVGLLTVAVLMV